VWTAEGGPAWQAFHNLSGDAYQKYFDIARCSRKALRGDKLITQLALSANWSCFRFDAEMKNGLDKLFLTCVLPRNFLSEVFITEHQEEWQNARQHQL
jgi:hypothetical protein